MKKPFILMLLGVLVGAGSVWSFQKGVKRSHYVDETYGFSLDAPRFPEVAGASNIIAAIFQGPAHGGFVSNVNVLVQRMKTTKAAYREQSLDQFKQGGFRVKSERELKVSGRDAIEYDYEGKFGGGRDLRFLSVAVIDADRVVLVTCTATADDFPAVEAEFRACVASLKLEGAARP